MARRTPRAARSIARILDAAASLFGQEGYRGASMKAVARAAGVSKGLLHYHFDSKQHLLIEAQAAAFRQIHARFDDRFQRGERGLDTALDALDALWESMRDMRGWCPFMVELMSLEAGAPEPSPAVTAFYEESMGLLERGVSDVFASDLEALGLSPVRLAAMVRTAMHGLIVELAYARSEEEVEQLDRTYRDLRDMFADAVRARLSSASE